MWLNVSGSLPSNFTPIWSCIENNDLCFDFKNWIYIDLNCLIDLAPRMEFSNLFDSLTQTGKKEYLKFSVFLEHNQPQLIEEKTLYQVSFNRSFSINLLIDWMENYLNNSFLPNKEIFFH